MGRNYIHKEMDFRTLKLVVFSLIILSLGEVVYGQEDRDEDFGTGDTACHLTSQSFYSYVVRIWNPTWGNTSSHGSMLTYKTVLTNCAPYVETTVNGDTTLSDYSKLEVYGHKLRSTTGTWKLDGSDVCHQMRKVKNVYKHPRCILAENLDLWFNFAVMELDQTFLVFRLHSHPAVNIPNTPDFAIYNIILVNILKESGCEIPLFYYHAHQKPVFASNLKVNSMRWTTECIGRLCEWAPHSPNAPFRYPGQWPGPRRDSDWIKRERAKHVEECKADVRRQMNYTNLCVYFPHSQTIKIGVEFMDIRRHLWTGGAPLVCNGTAIGITASAHDRTSMSTFRQDYYLVNTFIRVWAWLQDLRSNYGPEWLKPHYLEKDMRERGDHPVDPPPVPDVDPSLIRSWPEDEENLSTRAQHSISLVCAATLTSIFMVLFSRVYHATYFYLY